jgi:hypothetical protein
LPWTKKAPLDLFNAHRGAVPPPLGTTGLDNRLTVNCEILREREREKGVVVVRDTTLVGGWNTGYL